MIEYKNILYCTDFSEDAEIALYHALDLMQRHPEATLHILHCLHSTLRYTPTETDEMQPEGQVVTAGPDLVREVETDLKERYQGKLAGVKNLQWAARVGTAYVEILRYAREIKAEIIIMGAKGTSGREPTHYGSTVSHVAKHAHANVMAVRNPEATYHLSS